jgi:branched-chain amino acid transport system substrate-binding protein
MTARRRRLAPLLAAVTAAVLAASMAGCTSKDDQATPGSGGEVKIGLLAPLKGSQKGAGEEAQRGAQLAADVINGLNPSIPLPLAEGAGLPDLGGARIRILPADTSGDDPQAAAAGAVTKLISQQNVDALIGAYDPRVTEYASQRAERYEVPFVNADSPATFLTDRGLDWFFRLGPSWRTAGEAFFSLLRAQQTEGSTKLPKIVVLHADDKAGRDVNTTVGELAQEGGFPKPDHVPFSPTATDLIDAVAQVKTADPDVVMVYATPSAVQPLINAFAVKQYRPKAVFSFGLGYLTTENYRASADVVTGLCRSVSWANETAERNPAARAVANLYQRRFTTPMTEAAAAAFTAVLTVAQAVNSARSAEPTRIRTALLSLDVPGDQTIMPWGGVQFDETHQNVRAQVLVEQFLAGSFKVVYPGDAASRGLVYPADKARTLTS